MNLTKRTMLCALSEVVLASWALLATILWVKRTGPFDLAWGSIADWVTSVAALLALVAAVWAGRAAYGQMQIMQREAVSREQDSRESQARLVTVQEVQVPNADGRGDFALVVFNRSQEPIRDVLVSFIGPNNQNGFQVGTIPPSPGGGVVQGSRGLIEQARQSLLRQVPEEFRAVVDQLMSFQHAICFVDSRGVRWQRMPDTTLVEQPWDLVGYDATQAAVTYMETLTRSARGQ